MFFKDIDTWDKKKLVLVTAIVAVLYFIATCVIPCIFLACNYGIFERSSNYKLTGAGLIIAVILISFGGKAIKTLLGFLPRDKLMLILLVRQQRSALFLLCLVLL